MSSVKEWKKTGLKKLRTARLVLKQSGIRGVFQITSDRMEKIALQTRVAHFDSARGFNHPKVLQIETSSKCNLRCPTCSLARETIPGRNLTPEELRRILDKLSFHPGSVSLNGIGEPLINPYFFELVDILAERNINCTFITNGTMLVPRIREAILARPNITFIGISCDGAKKDTFESLRYGAKFETWKELVRTFLQGAHSRQIQPIVTKMGTVVSRQNVSELNEIVNLAAELGFRTLSFSDLMPNDDEAAEMAISADEWEAMDKEALVLRGKQSGVTVSFNYRQKGTLGKRKLRCYQPWDYSMISADGEVLPCCAIVGSDKAVVMGNVFQQDFGEIWNGEAFKAFRRSAANGTNELCKICPYY